jgi:hypothetical protein
VSLRADLAEFTPESEGEVTNIGGGWGARIGCLGSNRLPAFRDAGGVGDEALAIATTPTGWTFGLLARDLAEFALESGGEVTKNGGAEADISDAGD